jgi:hypothetical protein
MGEVDFNCDDCQSPFTIKQVGFIGEQKHLEQVLRREEVSDEISECSPMMTNFVTLCSFCLGLRRIPYDKNNPNIDNNLNPINKN